MNSFYNGKPCGCNSPSSGYYRVPNMTSNFKRLLCTSPEYADSINDLDNLLCGKFLPIRGGAHDRFKTYEDFTIVYDAETLVAYLSKKEVPYGVEITNREYWQPMNITGYADDNVIILNDKNVSGLIIPYTLETATKSIAEVARKLGKVLMFFSLEGGSHWEMWQFFGLDVSDWEDVSQWRSIYNVWNKFVGWYDTTEELYQLHVHPIDGKYALVGPTLKDVVIYQGTPGGWMPLDVNLYQKLLNDFLELVDDGVIVLTDCQKEILKEWLKEMGIGCDCDGSGGKDPWSSAWGPIGRPYTTFLVTTDFTSDETFKFTYPTSIFHDNSDEESVGQPALHSITLNGTGANPISLNFTAGTWSDIFTRFEPNAYIPYKDLQYKDDAGYMYININEMIPGLQYTIKRTYKGEVTDPWSVVRPFVNNLATRCDGADYEIHLMKPNNCKVTINYYDSVTSRIKTKTIEVPYGEPFPAPVITDATYIGHNFTGWATNNQDSVSDPDNPYNVVGRGTKVPAYYNFSQPITSDKVLNAWYNIDAVFDWNDNNGHHTVPRTANYNTNITDVPSVDAYTGYIFQGWRLGTTTIAPGNPVGPILKPITVNGVWQQEIPEYDYIVKNETGYEIEVTVGGQRQTIPNGETRTFTLENTPSATLTVTTTAPSDATKTVVWTINGSKASSKNVDAGPITIGSDITYNYTIYNSTGQNSIVVTVSNNDETITKTITDDELFVVHSATANITVVSNAPKDKTWVINGTAGSIKQDVPAGDTYITIKSNKRYIRVFGTLNPDTTGGRKYAIECLVRIGDVFTLNEYVNTAIAAIISEGEDTSWYEPTGDVRYVCFETYDPTIPGTMGNLNTELTVHSDIDLHYALRYIGPTE